MKRCPQCSTDYFDNLLEFCLEDGTKLVALSSAPLGTPSATNPNPAAPTVAMSSPLPFPGAPDPLDLRQHGEIETIVHAVSKDEQPALVSKAGKLLEPAPIVLALLHNWWQWIYLEKEYISSIASYILSANFLMWLLLLVGGTAISLFVLKKSENKTFAYVSLVILAINLILFLVPRR
jgi:hypothetical protein